jgi:EmrB/QacA subfamily drug resistance transporter
LSRYTVRVLEGSARGVEFDLSGELEIGRDPGLGLALGEDSLVSKRHARLEVRADGLVLEDLGSRNGTFVNGQRIQGAVFVQPGDRIVIGGTTLELQEVAAPEYVLQIVGGPGAGRAVTLVGPLEAGRDDAAGLPLHGDSLASRLHARLSPLVDGVAVEDLGSRNGTFVNGQRLEAPTLAKIGDQIQIGDTVLEVREAGAVAEPVAPDSMPDYTLDVVSGPSQGRQVRVGESLDVGREPAVGLALAEDHMVSRLHARLTPHASGLVVEDLGSRNGTFINGWAIKQPTLAGFGDQIVIGQTALQLRPDGFAVPGTVAGVAPGATWHGPVPAGVAEPPAQQGPDQVARRPLWTFVLCGIGLFMAVLDNLVVLFALPSIQVDLNATAQQLEWTVNAFTLPFAVCLLPAATLGDRFGRKRMFVIGLTVFTVASALCALAPNIELLLIGRAVQGLGGAVITPLSLTILSAAFPAERRGLVLGAWSGIAGLGAALGPVIGGALVSGFSWEWIFWINVPVGAVIVPLCLMRLLESHGPSDRLDFPGLVLVSVGLFGIIFAVIRASSAGWTSPEVVGSLLVGIVLMAAFIFWELRAPQPMLPLRLFKRRAFAAANGASFCMYFGLFGSIFLLSQFLQVVKGYSALEAGLRSLPWTGMPIFIAPIGGMLSERIGGRPLMALGLALQAVSLAWLALVLSPDVPYSHAVGAFIIGGAGMGLFFAPVAHVILGAVSLEEEGVASGANNAIREVGGVFGVAVMGTIFAAFGSYASPQDFTDGIIPPTWVGAVVVGLGALMSLAIPKHRPTHDAEVMSMAAGIPALGGFTPGVTLVRPALRPSPEAAAAPARSR